MNIQEFDFTVDLLQSILWQYNEAENLTGLLGKKQEWYDLYQSVFWQNWYDTIFNLATKTPSVFGLAIWSIILGIPLFVELAPEPADKPIWGFNAFAPSFPDLENTYLNFGTTITANPGSGNFSTRNQGIILTLAQQQFLLRLRYFQISTLGNIAGIPTSSDSVITTYSINTFLDYLCKDNAFGFTGTIYALDYLDMTMAYVITTDDFPFQLLNAILELDLFPRPAAVGIRYILNGQNIWGFGQFYQNFGNGTFIHYLEN